MLITSGYNCQQIHHCLQFESSLICIAILALRILLFVVNLAGYGLKCHRAIKTIAELMGIKDLHCKVEGSTKNVQTVTRGFFDALVHQVFAIPNY